MKCFSLAESNAHAFFRTPRGEPFFSMGMNHIDHAPLMTPENLPQWRKAYGGSRQAWLAQQVGPDLRAWGFNTVGWTQELCLGGAQITRHTPYFAPDEYRAMGLPFCHPLPFIEAHQWDETSFLPDIRGSEFAEWCDYVARTNCLELADEPGLIGYFYADGPIWVHPTRRRGRRPMFDPSRLAQPGGEAALHDLATCYYRVMHDAIRRYDRRHLILGDRYDANCLLPDAVLRAAAPYVDAISLQDFDKDPEGICGRIAHAAQVAGRPVLLCDAIVTTRPLANGAMTQEAYAATWRAFVRRVRDEPACVGIHVCGGYLRNDVRHARWRQLGCRDPRNQPVTATVNAFKAANADTACWLAAVTPSRPPAD